MEHREHLYIGGQWRRPADGTVVDVVAPATGEAIGRAALAGPHDIARAVTVAQEAFRSGEWPETSLDQRVDAILALAGLVDEQAERFAALIAQEAGSPISWVARPQVSDTTAMMRHLADVAAGTEWAARRRGFVNHVEVRRVPVGVVAAVIPWNFPLNLALSKITPALLMGCPVVLKPAEETPLSALALAELIDSLDLPAGVVSVVPATRVVSEQLVKHPGVDKVSFPGSTAAGRRIGALCGEAIRRCTLELGGKSAAILLPGVDVAAAVADVAPWTTYNNGQTCMNLTRVLAPASLYDDVVDALVDELSSSVVGDPTDEATTVGPLITARQLERVQKYVKDGVHDGARAIYTGVMNAEVDRGHFMRPVVFAAATNDMQIAREEIFGPVVSVIGYKDKTDAIRLANDSTYGLSGAVWGPDFELAMDVARKLRTGTVGINGLLTDDSAPFGGFKQSGIGRELGREGLEQMTELQSIAFRPPKDA